MPPRGVQSAGGDPQARGRGGCSPESQPRLPRELFLARGSASRAAPAPRPGWRRPPGGGARPPRRRRLLVRPARRARDLSMSGRARRPRAERRCVRLSPFARGRGAQRRCRAARPRREGRTRRRGARGRSPQPPPGDPQVSLWVGPAVGRGHGAPGSPGRQVGGAAGARESRLAAVPCARRLGEPLGRCESGWPLGRSSRGDRQSGRAELALPGARGD